MDLERIERLLDMFARAPVAELEFSEDGWRIRLTRAGTTPAVVGTAEASPPHVPTVNGPVAAPEAKRSAQGAHVVAAGLAGILHRRPAPDKPPFVAVGDLVEDGQTLGIMEAMKTLIGVEADRAGRISEIFWEDGASVQSGEPLFAIVPADIA